MYLGGHFRTQPNKDLRLGETVCALPGSCEENFLAMSCAPVILCVCLSHFLLFFPQMNLRVCQWISNESARLPVKLGGGWCTAKASTPQISKMLNSIGWTGPKSSNFAYFFYFIAFFSSNLCSDLFGWSLLAYPLLGFETKKIIFLFVDVHPKGLAVLSGVLHAVSSTMYLSRLCT